MAYTTIAKVRALIPENSLTDETTEPSDLTVAIWIPQVSARIDLALRAGGNVTPATDATITAFLDLLEAKEVAWMILYARGAAKEDHEYHVEFNELLATIMVDGLTLSGDGKPLVWSYTKDAETNGDAGMAPAFTRGKRY